MTMQHNSTTVGVCGTYGAQDVDTERRHTLVANITEHILSDEKAYTYARSEGGSASRGRVIHNLRNNNVERPVQAALRGAQPLDANVMLAPSFLEAVSVPVIDRIEIEGAAVTEVQARPGHVCFGRAHTLFGQDPILGSRSTGGVA